MNTIVLSASNFGLTGHIVRIETHIARGLPRFKIVGLPDKTVIESRERVISAIKASGYTFPLKRITINLSPSDIPKHGSGFELGMAIGIISASCQTRIEPEALKTCLISGGLSLNGRIRHTPGLPIFAEVSREKKIEKVIMPESISSLARSYLRTSNIYTPGSLRRCIRFLEGKIILDPIRDQERRLTTHLEKFSSMDSIAGNHDAKRAVLIAAAGRHHLALSGPPGCGKSMLANAMVTILSPLSTQELQEVSKIYSISQERQPERRPVRSPHHTINSTGMLGGGRPPHPGEVSLAHKGILVLNEFPDFSKDILRSLRSVLDKKSITLMSSKFRYNFPADLLAVVTMNDCPCGYAGHPTKKCACPPHQVRQYRSRIPGAVWDRIALHSRLTPEKYRILTTDDQKTTRIDEEYRNVVERAWREQKLRGFRNSDISLRKHRSMCKATHSAELLLNESYKKLGLSTRNLLQVLGVARTIADISEERVIKKSHIAEALSYRKSL